MKLLTTNLRRPKSFCMRISPGHECELFGRTAAAKPRLAQ
jgi:hypothetical protein